MKWRRLLWLAVLPPLVLGGMSMASCSVPELGIRNGALLPLPDRPNCVSSLATREAQRVPPLPLRGELAAAKAELKTIVAGLPRAELLAEESNYLRFQISSAVFRFKDDLEFHLVPEQGVIHVRAAARVGYSDMGVNRARVVTIRESLEQSRR